jgi:alpha-beta hydrolase superfamily lysophospholipase
MEYDTVLRRIARVDVGDIAPPGCAALCVEVIAPAAAARQAVSVALPVLVCLPGGAMSRRYFDLQAPGYSFAEYMGRRGFVTVLVDHPGIGDSDVPDDAWTLTAETVAQVDATATARVLAALERGDVPGLPPLRPTTVSGVGHSAGALILLHQQAMRRQFDGVALLGWCGRGLPGHLDDQERLLGALPGQSPDRFIEGAKRRFGEPLPALRRGSSRPLVPSAMPPALREALVAARGPLLAVIGLTSMIPGSAVSAAGAIDVPLFLGVGEHDIATDHHALPTEYPAAHDITLFVLAGAGHNHNAEPGRQALWARLASWADGLAAGGGGSRFTDRESPA